MKEMYSCHEAIEKCLKSRRFAIAHLLQEEKTMAMHIHDCYELYYSISGGKQFLIDNTCYPVNPGDLFIINNYESHCVSRVDDDAHERIVLSIHPDYLKALSSSDTDLTECFRRREGRLGCKLHLPQEGQSRFLYLIHKLQEVKGFGADLMENAIFTELMVLVNRLYGAGGEKAVEYQYHPVVEKIVAYINEHIGERITLSVLADSMFLSQAYICRIFKAETGTTINKYITARRISIAKARLGTGLTVAEACEQSGFNDYTNFVTLFTRMVGITPKQYALHNVR
jgi:AraC-like DNA-binding protein